MKKKVISMMLVAAMTVGVLAGCGSSSSSTGGDSTVAGTEAETGESSDAVVDITDTTLPTEGKPEGWTEADATEDLVVLTNGTFNNINKYITQTSGLSNAAFTSAVWDPILKKDEEGNMGPWLAESYELSDDSSVLTIKIRDDVYFTNGDELNADDFVLTFDEILNSENYTASDVANWRKYVESAEEIDEKTFALHFSNPMPEIWTQITTAFQVIDKDVFDEVGFDAYWEKPVGTGPYEFVSFDGTNSICELTIRSDENGYWGYDFENTYTTVKNMTIKYSPEETSREASLKAGEADIITNVAYDTAGSLTDEGMTVLKTLPTDMVMLQMTCGEGDAFGDEKLREALSLCIDRQGIVDAMLTGYATAVQWPAYTESVLGYEDESTGAYYQYDIERAKQLVEESSYDGRELKFIYSTSTVNIATELAQVIQSYAEQIGINLVVTPLEDALYEDARPNHDYDLCLASIIIIGNQWYLTAADIIGEDRFNTGLQDQELMDLGKTIAVTMDDEKLNELYKQMYDIEMTTFEPNLYLYCPSTLHASTANVSGVQFNGTGNINLSTIVKS